MITTILWIVWVAMVIAWAGFHIYSALSNRDCRRITKLLSILELLVILAIQVSNLVG